MPPGLNCMARRVTQRVPRLFSFSVQGVYEGGLVV